MTTVYPHPRRMWLARARTEDSSSIIRTVSEPAQQPLRLPNHLVEVQHPRRCGLLTTEGQELADESRAPLARPVDARDRVRGLFRPLVRASQKEFGRRQDDG